MKRKVSLFLALMSVMNVMVVGEAADVVSKAADFSKIEVTSDGKGLTGELNGLVVGREYTTADYSRLYKVNNVFGLDENEYGIELIARDNKSAHPYLFYKDSNEYGLDKDFYVQTVQYIGEVSNGDSIKVGGEVYDGSTKVRRAVYFQGTEDMSGDSRPERRGSSWDEDNWHTFTLAYDSDTKKLAMYIDDWHVVDNFAGTAIDDVTITNSINKIEYGIRVEGSDKKDVTYAVMSSAKFVAGEFDPTTVTTNLASDKYTVVKGSSYQDSSVKSTDAVISEIPFNSVTAKELIDSLKVPSGATAEVVRVDKYSKATEKIADSTIVADGMQVLVRAANGVSLKLYDIKVAPDTSLAPVVEFSNAGYSSKNTFDGTTFKVMPHTSVATALSMFSSPNGTEISFVNAAGDNISGNVALTSEMKLQAKKGGNVKTYAVAVADTIVKKSGEDSGYGTTKLDGTVTNNVLTWISGDLAGASGGKSLYGWNSSASVGSSYYSSHGTQWSKPANAPNGTFKATITNLPNTSDIVYKLESKYETTADATTPWWIVHSMEQTLAGIGAGAIGQTDSKKMIYKFKANVEEGGSLMILPYPAYSRASKNKSPGATSLNRVSGNTSTVKANSDYGTSVWFDGGNITLGGYSFTSRGYYATAGTYEPGENMEVTVVMTTPQSTNTLTVDGLYINGEKIYPTANLSWINTYSYSLIGIREFTFATRGTVYFGDFQFYTADEYCTATATDEEVDISELTIQSETVEIFEQDPLENNIPTVKRFGETVADLKDNLVCSEKADVCVLNREGDYELPLDYELEAGMILKVFGEKEPNVFKMYTLSDTLDIGKYVKTEIEGTITVKRTVKEYKGKGFSAVLVGASYDENGRLTGVDIDEHVVSDEEYEFSVRLTKNDINKIIFMENIQNIKPYEDVRYTEDIATVGGLTMDIDGIMGTYYGAIDAIVFE